MKIRKKMLSVFCAAMLLGTITSVSYTHLTFTLYLGAGMPARRAWFQIASVYRQQENTRYVYEEMVYTCLLYTSKN